ncbi:MAG: DUF4293 family protein [Muribaculaceae bacterium]|nr:DUF4293 family protein [Muribaculaceae bacterium]MDD6869711.1 DUF4293 family protein [bacterium]MDY5826769.1 DUF4293 family protein [Candidatus Limisoma sp.]
MLQRWQSIYLFIAASSMGMAAASSPFKGMEGDIFSPNEGITLVARILCGIVAALAVVTIFKYKNLKLQALLCSVTAMMAVVAFGLMLAEYFCSSLHLNFTIVAYQPVFAFICLLLARSRVKADYKLIHDCDRLR